MSKSILVIDTPKVCIDCPCHFADDAMIWCGKERKEILSDDIETFKPDWCPIRDLPEKRKRQNVQLNYDCGYSHGYTNGFNACVDEILKGENRNE